MLDNQLRIFLTVCERGTMTAAAGELFMTQSAVSQAIASLEEHYGVKLFDRFPRRLELTDIGRTLKSAAQNIIRSIDETEDALHAQEEEGDVRIGVNLSTGKVLIHPYLKEFRTIHPNSKVSIVATRGSVLTSRLNHNELDFLLMEKAEGDDYLEEVFYKDRIVMVVNPKDTLLKRRKLRFEELSNEPFLLREKGAGVREQFDHLCKAYGIDVNIAWESSSTSILINALRHGESGIAVVPYLLVKDKIASGEIAELPIRDACLERDLFIVRHKSKHLSKPAQDMIEIIRSSAGVA